MLSIHITFDLPPLLYSDSAFEGIAEIKNNPKEHNSAHSKSVAPSCELLVVTEARDGVGQPWPSVLHEDWPRNREHHRVMGLARV